MSEARTVLEHLLEGRRALVLEAERLTAAIAELDAVIGRIGAIRFDPSASAAAALAPVAGPADLPAADAPTRRPARQPASRRRTRLPAKKAATRRDAGSDGTKSIRERVLDILGAEDRDFSLAEIIDRIHEAGVNPHDDAVRSITIKLMNAGQVERVGRGQYRLSARARGSSTAGHAAGETASAPGAAEAESFTPPLNLEQPWSEAPQG